MGLIFADGKGNAIPVGGGHSQKFISVALDPTYVDRGNLAIMLDPAKNNSARIIGSFHLSKEIKADTVFAVADTKKQISFATKATEIGNSAHVVHLKTDGNKLMFDFAMTANHDILVWNTLDNELVLK